jgi:glycosyltransferase involved in cell wall biosynthesis
MQAPQDLPEFSVVIPVRRAVETVEDTVGRLLDRDGLEVIAVVSSEDPTAALLRQLQNLQPRLVLLEIPGDHSVPQLRAHGIRAARGRFVAITEDHCELSPGWPKMLAAALKDPEVGAAGGGVANGRRHSFADWAIYFSRYATLMPPLPRGPARALPGNNACYRRELLESQREFYKNGFWEHEFHQHLQRQGLRLMQEPEAIARHRKPYRFGAYLRLRFRHGRCFGGMIRRSGGFRAVAARVLLSPLTPLLLALRSARAVVPKQAYRREFCFALPLLLLCYAAWAAGEAAGCLLGPGQACSQTD